MSEPILFEHLLQIALNALQRKVPLTWSMTKLHQISSHGSICNGYVDNIVLDLFATLLKLVAVVDQVSIPEVPNMQQCMEIQIVPDCLRLWLRTCASQIRKGLAAIWFLACVDWILLFFWQTDEESCTRLIPIVDSDNVIVVPRSSDSVS